MAPMPSKATTEQEKRKPLSLICLTLRALTIYIPF
jgi:hypothetical protein